MSEYEDKIQFVRDQRKKITDYGLSVDPHFWQYSEDDLAMIINGCGPTKAIESSSNIAKKINKFVAWIIPDKWIDLDLSPCCSAHDFGYEIGKTDEDKKKEDTRFKNNIDKMISIQTPWYLKWINHQIGLFYYQMVSDFGEDAFKNKEVKK